jgi:hypothetical protein
MKTKITIHPTAAAAIAQAVDHSKTRIRESIDRAAADLAKRIVNQPLSFGGLPIFYDDTLEPGTVELRNRKTGAVMRLQMSK